MNCMYTAQGSLICDNQKLNSHTTERFVNEITNDPPLQTANLNCLIQQSNLQQQLGKACTVNYIPGGNECKLPVTCTNS